MTEPHRIDLHMHTTVSDGTDTPEAILNHVKESGIGLFAITDHDAIKGCGVIQQMRKPEDPQFLTGVEFSCRDEEGQYHILGYGYDPEAESMRELVKKGHRLRMEKIDTRMKFLETEFGITFPSEEILGHVKESGIGLFAITDHDAIKGCGVIQQLRKP